ncbi:hypothetical protein RN001_016160 [Aquatica leii]|uniref:Uncharacterized protein n=1 Tax=Aquatica leii TaxID=1421715 RepID=A0AAN7NZ10_9COLE|nr:hypothetical protein RN001_016160 [Aquatica leii]
MGLLVGMPKANFGNTNDGNTSRRFFENPKLASKITGISYLIFRLKDYKKKTKISSFSSETLTLLLSAQPNPTVSSERDEDEISKED